MTAQPRIVIVGGGPAGLMAAEICVRGGAKVDVYDAMPSVGRKFLLAGKGGLNLTHSEPFDLFGKRYADRQPRLQPFIDAMTPAELRSWAHGLGVSTFVGSSGRVFPAEMKAAPLLRAWLHRLREAGVVFHMRHRWTGWETDSQQKVSAAPRSGHQGEDAPLAIVNALPLRFHVGRPRGGAVPLSGTEHPTNGATDITDGGSAAESPAVVATEADAVVLALGGASWKRLGSDGRWMPVLAARGVRVAPFKPANCGFDIGWSAFFAQRFAGAPMKSVAIAIAPDDLALTLASSERPTIPGLQTAVRAEWRRGEFVITQTGVEGSLIYALSAALRDRIERHGSAWILLDLLPDRSAEFVRDAIARQRGSRSIANHLRARLGIEGVKASLLREALTQSQMSDDALVAATLKGMPLKLQAPRPLDEAISTAGGVEFESLDKDLMLKQMPGVFCAGEMLDWEAPTGGYLLTACFATGRAAGLGALQFVAQATERRLVADSNTNP